MPSDATLEAVVTAARAPSKRKKDVFKKSNFVHGADLYDLLN